MKLALISDIHGNLEALQATLRAISAEGVDRIICLGDIVGYNANPAECIALVREAGIACVAGNHDWAVAGRITTEDFVETAARAAEWTRVRLSAEELAFLADLPLEISLPGELIAVHGALLDQGGCHTTRLDTEERLLASFRVLSAHPSGATVCAFGHTHQQGIYEFHDGRIKAYCDDQVNLRPGCCYLVNPGTVGQPRSTEWRATYMVLDTTRKVISLRRVTYDRSAALAKTRRAGLLPHAAPDKTLLAALRRCVPAWRLREGARRLAAFFRRRRHGA